MPHDEHSFLRLGGYEAENATARTFRFEYAELPLPTMAQSWLISRGFPKEAMSLPDGMGTRPADEATRALQERLIGPCSVARK
ncbi:hypothetical protein [Streptomyces sp. XH2]|uniref:hypothetical protein n=1 Tax=Streptomyces sp. XH2 TaxID=3412483 RepID=UPI003C7B28F5